MNLKKLMQFNNPPGKIKNNVTTPHFKKSIGSSSSRLALLLIALVFACLGLRQSAQAGYIVTLQQVGPDVVATGSGAINLTGLTFSHSGSINPAINPFSNSFLVRGASIYTGPASSSVDSYFVPQSGPTSFGSGGLTLASSGSGDMVGIFEGFIYGDPQGLLSVPRGYVSGDFSIGHGDLQRHDSCIPRRSTGHLRMDVGNRSEPELHAKNPIGNPTGERASDRHN